MPSTSTLLTTFVALAATASAVTPVVVDGKDFVNSETKERFPIIGVDYQPGGAGGFSTKKDPLSSPKDCLRDAALMQRLGVNTIRVYNLSPSLNHDECASIFNAAGIYMILDVNSPLQGDNLDRTQPWNSYNPGYFKQVFGIIEGFKDYPNTLAFFSGNEVINEQAAHTAPAYIRAVQRDMKAYIAKHATRHIPVGYSAADVRSILLDQANYFQCSISDADSHADLFGLNSYSWCGDSDYHASGYDVLTEDFANSSVPVIFSEYGCNAVQPRKFSEVQALYGKEMTQAFAGGLVYEYAQEENDYGLVVVDSSGNAKLREDYEALREQYGKLDMDRLKKASKAHTDAEPVECSASLITSGKFLDSFELPERPHGVQAMIDDGCGAKVGKIVGFGGRDVTQKIHGANGEELSGVKLDMKESESGEKHATDDKNSDDKEDDEKNDDGDKSEDNNGDKENDEDKENKHSSNDDNEDSDNDASSKSTTEPTTVTSSANAQTTPTPTPSKHNANAISTPSSSTIIHATATGSAIPSASATPTYYTGDGSKPSSSMLLGLLSGLAGLVALL
ncbi:1,3-beta-glucanosyltransferase gel2 [Aspergillus chevalieri]|uniref:1,3-beta-glucanosyltransferase n=1 Tax=Aspergillus chevalieri TaxID=182096 RepID=A0A7R7ZR17_ASPCH|nr:1 3-beta-glucanosyltransferase gel2 [Aspergillus chevalieri]BCR90214.1 1 3-beta-glucanosyltransferase gel2 [Aspergillus chevalieri]